MSAARCASLDALNCLLSLNADPSMFDERGYSAVHYAALYNNVDCLERIICEARACFISEIGVALRSRTLFAMFTFLIS